MRFIITKADMVSQTQCIMLIGQLLWMLSPIMPSADRPPQVHALTSKCTRFASVRRSPLEHRALELSALCDVNVAQREPFPDCLNVSLCFTFAAEHIFESILMHLCT